MRADEVSNEDDILDHLETTGRWWEANCWTDGTIRNSRQHSDHVIQSAISHLSDAVAPMTVHSSYLDRSPLPLLDTVMNSLFAKDIDCLVRFHELLGWCSERSGSPSIVQRLHTPGPDSRSAYMELKWGLTIELAGMFATFPAPKSKAGKSPDIIGWSDPGTTEPLIAVECKRLERSQKDNWISAYNELAWRALIPALKGCWYQLQLYPVDVDSNFSGGTQLHSPEEHLRSRNEQLTALATAIHSIDSVRAVDIPDFVQGTIDPTRPSEGSELALLGHSPERYWHRICANGIERASEQLPKHDIPGVVVIHTEHIPPPQAAQPAFEDWCLHSEASHLTGVLIQNWNNIIHGTDYWFLHNPAATHSFRSPAVIRVLSHVNAKVPITPSLGE
ncbi:MAG: hypothetical protein PF961_12165 [Planctomycetota bacterium]|jgi:hypothetical protein|nr:hypothetical protein [Planctomycetota bacterium]